MLYLNIGVGKYYKERYEHIGTLCWQVTQLIKSLQIISMYIINQK